MKKIIYVSLFIALTTLLINSHLSVAQINSQPLPKVPPTLKLSDPLPGNLFVELAKAINPAVVNISTSAMPSQRQYRDPMLEMLEKFYGLPPGGGGGYAGPNRPQRMGLGTGFIIRDDGLIVTNAHVIQGADIIEVQLTNNADKQYKAEVVGLDERTDIALIKIKPDTKLTAVVLGSSDAAEVGEWVAAFGNPFGHGHSMSKGIISSKGREIGEINRLPLIQTDASINPGNSGGPLVNSKGLVIGVNSAIDARAQGIGFAIPIDEVKKIIPQLEQRGSIRKGFLGVSLGDIDNRAAAQRGLEEISGTVVLNVGDGPAKKAGVQMYDLITEFNGRKIRNSRDLTDQVAATDPGTKIKLKVLRGEKTINIDVTVAERPEEKSLARRMNVPQQKPPVAGKKAPHSLGIEISEPTTKIKQLFNLDPATKNPVIASVANDSLGYRVGLKAGDIILSINKVEPKTASQAISLFKKGQQNTIRLIRGKGMSVITFDI